jgi:hypothetical protein
VPHPNCLEKSLVQSSAENHQGHLIDRQFESSIAGNTIQLNEPTEESSILTKPACLLAHVTTSQKLLSRDRLDDGHTDTDGDSDNTQDPGTLVVAF